jgi:hypothetical protein
VNFVGICGSLRLIPIRLNQAEGEFSLVDGLTERLETCFTRGSGHGLLQLGAGETESSLPASLARWRDFALRFVADLCALGERAQADKRRDLPAPAASDLTALIEQGAADAGRLRDIPAHDCVATCKPLLIPRVQHFQRPASSHLSKNAPSLQGHGDADVARSRRCGVSLTCQQICYVLYLVT